MAKKKQSVMQEMQTQLKEQQLIDDIANDEFISLWDTEADQEEFAREYLKAKDIEEAGEEKIAEFEPEPDEDTPVVHNESTITEASVPANDNAPAIEEVIVEEEGREEEPFPKKGEKDLLPNVARPDLLLPEDEPVFTENMSAEDIVDVARMAALASGERTTVFDFNDNEIEIIPEENDNAALKLKRALDPNKFADQMKGVNVYINGIQVDKETFKNFIDQDKAGFVKAITEAFPNIAHQINKMNQRIDHAVEKGLAKGDDGDKAILNAVAKEEAKVEKTVAKTSQKAERKMTEAGVPNYKGGKIEGVSLPENASDLDKQIHEARIRSAKNEISRTEEIVYKQLPANRSVMVLLHNPSTQEADHVVEFSKFGGKTTTRVDGNVDFRDANGVTNLQKLAEQYPGQLEINTRKQVEYLVEKESKSHGFKKNRAGEAR